MVGQNHRGRKRSTKKYSGVSDLAFEKLPVPPSIINQSEAWKEVMNAWCQLLPRLRFPLRERRDAIGRPRGAGRSIDLCR